MIIFCAARKNLDRAANLVVAPDDRIKLAFPGQLRQVFGVLREGLIILFSILVRDAHAAARLLYDFEQVVVVDAVLS